MTIQEWEKSADAAAYEFITAGGMNTPEQVTDLLSDEDARRNAHAFTNEAFETFEMHVARDSFYLACLSFIYNRPDLHAKASRFMVEYSDPDWPEMSLDEWLVEHANELPGDVIKEGRSLLAEFADAGVA